MGQYYSAANLDKREVLDQHDFGTGLKLMESCYVGNPFVDALTHLLASDWHGDNVVFCGDYAWEFGKDEWSGRRLRELADRDPYQAAESFKDRSGDFLDRPLGAGVRTYRYLVNETLGVYCDRREAPVAWVGWWKGEPIITRTDPLTIFMALGNGLGGGDYHRQAEQSDGLPNERLVGSWAGHVIGASDEMPVGLRRVDCPFDKTGQFVCDSDDLIKAAMALAHLDWAHTSVPELKAAIGELREAEGLGAIEANARAAAMGSTGAVESRRTRER